MASSLPISIREVVSDITENDALTFHIADEPQTSNSTLYGYDVLDSGSEELVSNGGQFIYPINNYCVNEKGFVISNMFATGYESGRSAYGKRFKVTPFSEQDKPTETSEKIRLYSSIKPKFLSLNPGFFIFRHCVKLAPQPEIRETDNGYERFYSGGYRLTQPILEYTVRGKEERDILLDYFDAYKLGPRVVWLALTEKYAKPGMQKYAPTTPSWDYLDQTS